jgi:5-methylthioadenosine/S-adenosylhomocysteine deaminase
VASRAAWLGVGLVVALAFGCGGDAVQPTDLGVSHDGFSIGAADRFLIGGTLLTPTGPLVGEVLVQGNLITCVAPSCSDQPGAVGATEIRLGGLVIPGLIDAHNHGLFDIFDESDWTPSQLYTNHNQWTAETRYQQMVDAKQYLDSETVGSTIDVNCEMDKYAEVKALVAATTSILVAPGASRNCYATLARTIDTTASGLATDAIQTSISVPANTTAATICGNFTSGFTNAYVVHIAEGTDATAKNEFATLASRSGGCLIAPQTTIVHGTALGPTEFTQMAGAGMRLVWSPKSNVFLYGSATRVDQAVAAGVQVIALAPDWSLGGSVNLLDELAFANTWDDANLGDALTTRRLFDMVTIDAARALGVDAQLGSLEVGKRADIALVAGDPNDPYGAMVRLHPGAVQLVMIDGRVLYGDAPLKAAGPILPGCEPLTVCGVEKFLCAAEGSTVDKRDQTFAQIVQNLEQALTTYDAMVAPSGVAPFSPLAALTTCP